VIEVWIKTVRWFPHGGPKLVVHHVRAADRLGVTHAVAATEGELAKRLRALGGYRLHRGPAPIRWGD